MLESEVAFRFSGMPFVRLLALLLADVASRREQSSRRRVTIVALALLPCGTSCLPRPDFLPFFIALRPLAVFCSRVGGGFPLGG